MRDATTIPRFYDKSADALEMATAAKASYDLHRHEHATAAAISAIYFN
jgi:hypothetical protein